jgi:hypothetical protein
MTIISQTKQMILCFISFVCLSLLQMNVLNFEQLLTGMTAGGVGALVGTPAEVALIRLMADGRCSQNVQLLFFPLI